ncbi:uncharacterized protein LTR77_010782 [Saxophila tyrrhenica]|uniref:SMP domain-containing protein n=1 Tax=Saxophila tyrrhenica TaxID=1690608 RepID=A0AAV9NX80_9PEZI|nr:hypothetical protein LTR77_010782 [Saxophila tyrrhenica]
MSGPIDSNRELLSQLKQDESNTYHSSDPPATKEHIAGAEGKLSSAMAQAEGSSDLNTGAQRLAREVPKAGGEVDRDAVQESLHARAQEAIEKQTGGDPMPKGKGSSEMNMEKGSEAARLQSAAEQYDQAREARIDGGESKY